MNEYMKAAIKEAERSRCDRAHVGCVIVDNETGQIVSRAFNETIKANEPCDTGGHHMVDGHCKNTIHAELGAIINLIKDGEEDLGEHTLYTTHYPCPGCSVAIALCPEITKVVYLNDYENSPLAAMRLEELPEGVEHVEAETGA